MVYLIIGTNAFRAQQEIAALAKKCNATPEIIDVDGLDLNKLADIVRGASLFEPRRFIVLRQLSVQKELWEKMSEWANDVPDDTTLVLVENKPDRRTKAYKTLARAASVITAAPLTEKQRPEVERWLNDLATSYGITLTRDQASNMIARATVPNESSRLSEIDQFQLLHAVAALSNLDKVTDEAIATVLPPAREFSVFDLLELAARGDSAATRRALDELRANDEAYKVMALLWAQWSQLVAVAMAGDKSSAQIASDLTIHPFVAKKMQSLAPRFSSADLHDLTSLAAELDFQSKTTNIAPWDVIDRFVLEVSLRQNKLAHN